MALVTPIPAMGERAGSMRFHGKVKQEQYYGRNGFEAENIRCCGQTRSQEQVYTHLGIIAKICLIHVHQPSQMIPVMGAKFQEEQVKVFREKEREKVHMVLDEYIFVYMSAERG
uniref:U-box domain-containing protein 33 n=1 Tax=Noccaea caerulescens TaxID=107243 RepID=A0A1J3ERB2_NOCCA